MIVRAQGDGLTPWRSHAVAVDSCEKLDKREGHYSPPWDRGQSE